MAQRKARKVPAGRLSRKTKMASLAGGLAGGVLAEGARKLKAGESLNAGELIMTPANARRVADQLANMRGAAMKLGQILSMDTGDLLPPEWSEVLARLRADADPMPINQLEAQLEAALGDEWPEQLYGLDFSPLASASIGQVHRAVGPGGQPVAVKVQYPGIAKSIDSDVDNVATLLKSSGILPAGIDIEPMLVEVKAQLHDEANYVTEAGHLLAYRKKLADDSRFAVPELFPELSTDTVLCMEFMQAEAIESLADQPQKEVNRVMTALVELMFTELFEWRLVQTDPNFANYLYRQEDGAIVLLDFGATRSFKSAFVKHYRTLAAAAIAGEREKLLAAAVKLGYMDKTASEPIRELMLDIFMGGAEPMLIDAPYDFAGSDIAATMQELGMELQTLMQSTDDGWHNPPVDAMYFHRKIAGMFMLAARLGAQVNVRGAIAPYL